MTATKWLKINAIVSGWQNVFRAVILHLGLKASVNNLTIREYPRLKNWLRPLFPFC